MARPARVVLGLLTAAALLLPAAPVVAAPAVAPAAPAPADRLQTLLDELVAAGVSGVVGVVDDGRRTRTYTSGVAVVQPRVPMRPDSRLRVGSTTKTFVATVLLQLVGEGRLRLDDTVGRWLPGLVPAGDRITLRQLLAHTSGLFDYSDDDAFQAAFAADLERWWAPRELVGVATSHPLLFPPGTGWSYSNTNYVLAGLVLERVTGQTVRQLLRSRIIEPLDLASTSYAGDDWRGPHAHGYLPPSLSGAGYVDLSEIDPSWASHAGAVVSSAGDLRTFYEALMSGRLLRPAELREMRRTVATPSPLTRFGLGVYTLRGPCGTAWGHDGKVPGYSTIAFTDAQGRRSASLAVTSELDERTGALWTLATETALCQMFGAPTAPAAPAAPTAPAAPSAPLVDRAPAVRTDLVAVVRP